MKLLPPVLSVVMHSLSHQCYCGSCALAELITAAQSLLVRLDRVLPVLLLISPNMPRFLHTYVMFCNDFLISQRILYRISALVCNWLWPILLSIDWFRF